MSEITRRVLLRTTGIAVAGMPAMGQTHHHAVITAAEAQSAGSRFLQPAEFATLEVLCDVRSTFEEAPRVFGPQKGADARMVKRL